MARAESPVLIRGESGTGKEPIARSIVQKIERADKPCLPVTCGAFHDEPLESELFGHEKGAFTGAAAQRHGLFEKATRAGPPSSSGSTSRPSPPRSGPMG